MKDQHQVGYDRPGPWSSPAKSRLSAGGQADGQEQLSLVEIAKIAVEDVLDLLSSQVKLARFELGADVREAIGRVLPLAVLVPIALGGYLFGMAAIASAISGIWGWTIALAIVGAAQVLVGAAGIGIVVKRLGASRVLERTTTDAAANLKGVAVAVSSPKRMRV